MLRLAFVYLLISAGILNAHPKPGETTEVEIAKGVKMTFCWIPEGQATLGSPATEKGRDENEFEHIFNCRGFWLAKFPVTQGEWMVIMGNNPSDFSKNGRRKEDVSGLNTDRLPVDHVAWHDCQAFVNKLNESAKLPAATWKGRFALPHENEWEYACRGGKGNKLPYYFGDKLNGVLANVRGSEPYGTTIKGPFLKRTTEVGSYEKVAPHPWGLCDMIGNVWQWCENKPNTDDNDRARRGGSWTSFSEEARAACRSSSVDLSRMNFYGFRVAIVRAD